MAHALQPNSLTIGPVHYTKGAEPFTGMKHILFLEFFSILEK